MAGVVKATVGWGYLGPGQTSWWKWYITKDDAWYFWPSNWFGGPGTVEVVRMVSGDGPSMDSTGKHAAHIQLRNSSSSGGAYFYLRVVRVY